MTMNEPLAPAPETLAALAVEAAPHLDLLARIGGHLDVVLRAAAILNNDWTEIEAAMHAANAAPEALRPAFFKATWDTYGHRYGLPSALMGALAAARGARPVPENKAAPEKDAPQAAPAPTAPATPPRPPEADKPKSGPRPSSRSPEQLDALADLLDAMRPEILAVPSRKALAERLGRVGVRVSPSVLASISTGWMSRACRNRVGGGVIGMKVAEDLQAGLALLAEEREGESRLLAAPPAPVKAAPTPAPPAPPAPVGTAPKAAALPATRKERIAAINRLLDRNNGVVQLAEVIRACGVNSGAAVGLLAGMGRDVRHVGGGTYRRA